MGSAHPQRGGVGTTQRDGAGTPINGWGQQGHKGVVLAHPQRGGASTATKGWGDDKHTQGGFATWWRCVFMRHFLHNRTELHVYYVLVLNSTSWVSKQPRRHTVNVLTEQQQYDETGLFQPVILS